MRDRIAHVSAEGLSLLNTCRAMGAMTFTSRNAKSRKTPNIPVTALAQRTPTGKISLDLNKDVAACMNSNLVLQPCAVGEGAAACKHVVPKKSVRLAFGKRLW